MPRPCWCVEPSATTAAEQTTGPFGEIMSEAEFWGLLRLADDFALVHLDERVAAEALDRLRRHPLFAATDLGKLSDGEPADKVADQASQPGNLALHDGGGHLVGYVVPGYAGDASQSAEILLENLAAKASGALALRHLFRQTGTASERVAYLLGCGEEAVGDRYQRGGGSLSKAMAEMAGLADADGADVKACCSAPVHALVMAAALVETTVASAHDVPVPSGLPG